MFPNPQTPLPRSGGCPGVPSVGHALAWGCKGVVGHTKFHFVGKFFGSFHQCLVSLKNVASIFDGFHCADIGIRVGRLPRTQTAKLDSNCFSKKCFRQETGSSALRIQGVFTHVVIHKNQCTSASSTYKGDTPHTFALLLSCHWSDIPHRHHIEHESCGKEVWASKHCSNAHT